MRLIERHDALVQLTELLEDCRHGRNAVAVISGPVATGKSTVLQEFADGATRSGAVFVAADGSYADRWSALGVLNQLFEELQAVAGGRGKALGPVDGVTNGEALFQAIYRHLLQIVGEVPVVLAIDGARQADALSLRYLAQILRRTRSLPVLVVLTETGHQAPVDPAAYGEIVRHARCRRIRIAQLSESGVERLLSEYLDEGTAKQLAPACHRASGGSPLLARAIAEDYRAAVRARVPSGRATGAGVDRPTQAFRQAVTDCLYRSDPDMIAVAHATAVLGEHVSPKALGRMLHLRRAAVERAGAALREAGLLDGGRMVDPDVRAATLGHMTADVRVALHRSAAAALYQTGDPAHVVAEHLVRANYVESGWGIGVLLEAANQILIRGGVTDALECLALARRAVMDKRDRIVVQENRLPGVADALCAVLDGRNHVDAEMKTAVAVVRDFVWWSQPDVLPPRRPAQPAGDPSPDAGGFDLAVGEDLSNASHALGNSEHARAYTRCAWQLAPKTQAAALCRTLQPKLAEAVSRGAGSREAQTAVPGSPDYLAHLRSARSLSDAERRVAALAAEGHTNRQIANRLYITVSTVEQHLTRIYRKLNVNRRTDLHTELWFGLAEAG